MSAPIEVTTRYVTCVDDLPAAWEFVMSRIDQAGPNPRVCISPITVMPVGDMIAGLDGAPDPEWKREFEVTVEGMVHEGGAS